MSDVQVDVFRGGRAWSSETRKDGMNSVDAASTSPVKQSDRLRKSLSLTSGRTVNLGSFNFARVDVGIEFDYNGEHGNAYDAALGIIDEIINRECAALNGDGRTDILIERPDDAVNVCVTVQYGLTISLKNMNSAKIDYGMKNPISDDADLEASFKELQDFISKKISARKDALRNGTASEFGL
jgi:hypothetical protein